MLKSLSVLTLFVSSLFAASAPPTATSVTALQALAPGAYPTVQLLGYSAAGDGGGGVVNWVASSVKPAAACSVYVPTSNPAIGRWERPSSPFRLAAQCGVATLDDTISGVITYPNLTGSGTRMVVVGATGTASTQTIPAGGSLADPSATIGLTPVNGSATSAMRSDGAPPLSQAIAPTWSAKHTFSLAPRFSSVNASEFLLVDGTKDLTSVGSSGTGNVVRVTSPTIAAPTLTGTTAGTASTWSSTVDVTGKLTTSDTLGAGLGVRIGTIAASSVNLYRSSANMLKTDDSLTVGGSLFAPVIAGAVQLPNLAGTGTRMVVVDASGNTSTQSIPAGGSLADPSATIGLTAVNGSATSGMRSDGAPALSQAIVPTWSGKHTFSLAPRFSSVNASEFLLVDASKDLTSVGSSGTGNVVRVTSPSIASPTFTGTAAGASATWSSAVDVTGKLTTSDTLGAGLGVRIGTIAATSVNLYRAGADMLKTDDSLTVGGSLYAPVIAGAVQLPSLAGSGTRMVVVDASGNTSTQSIPAGGSLANPTATIGLTAVNGSATSGMRSDGAPALSQAIAPTWTNTHTFNGAVNLNSTVALGTSAVVTNSSATSILQYGSTFIQLGAGAHWTELYYDLASTGVHHFQIHDSDKVTMSSAGIVNIGDLYSGNGTKGKGYWLGTSGSQAYGLYADSGYDSQAGSKNLILKANTKFAFDARPDSTFSNHSQISIGSSNATATPDFGDLLFNLRHEIDFNFAGTNAIVANATNFLLQSPVTFTSHGLSVFDSVITHKATFAPPSATPVTTGSDTLDMRKSSFFSVTMTGNITLVFKNAASGAHFTIRLKQDGTGGRTVTYPATCRFPGGTQPTLTTAANAVDYLSFIYDEAAVKWDFIGNALNLQ